LLLVLTAFGNYCFWCFTTFGSLLLLVLYCFSIFSPFSTKIREESVSINALRYLISRMIHTFPTPHIADPFSFPAATFPVHCRAHFRFNPDRSLLSNLNLIYFIFAVSL